MRRWKIKNKMSNKEDNDEQREKAKTERWKTITTQTRLFQRFHCITLTTPRLRNSYRGKIKSIALKFVTKRILLNGKRVALSKRNINISNQQFFHPISVAFYLNSRIAILRPLHCRLDIMLPTKSQPKTTSEVQSV